MKRTFVEGKNPSTTFERRKNSQRQKISQRRNTNPHRDGEGYSQNTEGAITNVRSQNAPAAHVGLGRGLQPLSPARRPFFQCYFTPRVQGATLESIRAPSQQRSKLAGLCDAAGVHGGNASG